MKNIKVLIVEDNDFDFELIQRKIKAFENPHLIEKVTDENEFRKGLLKFRPHIVLSDFNLPSFSGIRALQITKSYDNNIPFIFVSGSIGEEKAVETLKEGANDYVLKHNLNKLEHAIGRALKESKERKRRRKAEEKLKIRNNELRTLIYRISHDIKGPICNIQGAINLFKRDDKTDGEFFYLDIIQKETKRLSNIIKNLSNFQFIFGESVNFSLLNLQDTIEEIKAATEDIEGYHNVDFDLQFKGEPMVRSEGNILLCIMFNLIHNAIVFLDNEKSYKYVRCSIVNEKDKLKIVVKDNGIGIPQEISDKVYDMFYRGNSASKGAGIGLYIVNTCVSILNGKMKIISEQNMGTQVMVKIPLKKKDESALQLNSTGI